MSALWTALPVDAYDHPRMLAAGCDADGGDSAYAMWCAALSYVKRHRTEGTIPEGALRRLVHAEHPETVAACLVRHGLWERAEGGYALVELSALTPARARRAIPSESSQPAAAQAPVTSQGPLSAAERKRRQRDRERDSERDMSRDMSRDSAVTSRDSERDMSRDSVVTGRDMSRDIGRDTSRSMLSGSSGSGETESEKEPEKEKSTDSAREADVTAGRDMSRDSERDSRDADRDRRDSERDTRDVTAASRVTETSADSPLSESPENSGPSSSTRRSAQANDTDRVLQHWAATLYPTTRPVFDQKRIRRVKARLAEGFTAERLKRAIDGAVLDDWLMGRAEGARKGGWRDIETVFRDAAQVERLIALADAQAPSAPARRTATPDLDDEDTRDLTPEELAANARAASELVACLVSGRPVAGVAPPTPRPAPAPVPVPPAPVAPIELSAEERAELDMLAATTARRRAQIAQERAAAAESHPVSETVPRGAP